MIILVIYRMSNINAAIGCAQLENFDIILKIKEFFSIDIQAVMNFRC